MYFWLAEVVGLTGIILYQPASHCLLGHEIKRIEKKVIKDDSDINLPQAHDYPKTRKALLIFTGLIPFAYLASLPYLSKLKYAYSLQSYSD